MTRRRRRFSAAEKAKIALEAIKGAHTISEIAQRFEVHPTQVNTWRRELIERVPTLFGEKQDGVAVQDQGRLIDELYKQIGQLMVERDWLKKADQIS